jgi:hypothetical protein
MTIYTYTHCQHPSFIAVNTVQAFIHMHIEMTRGVSPCLDDILLLVVALR